MEIILLLLVGGAVAYGIGHSSGSGGGGGDAAGKKKGAPSPTGGPDPTGTARNPSDSTDPAKTFFDGLGAAGKGIGGALSGWNSSSDNTSGDPFTSTPSDGSDAVLFDNYQLDGGLGNDRFGSGSAPSAFAGSGSDPLGIQGSSTIGNDTGGADPFGIGTLDAPSL